LRERLGPDMAIVSVGGVQSARDVAERLAAGATLVQAYTAFIYGGPLWPWRVQRGLARQLSDVGSNRAAGGR
jgi:dihydroorotate dehydrogenase